MTKIIRLEETKGYATEKNLMAALERNNLLDWEMALQIIIVRKPDGKWTAIFRLDTTKGGYIGAAASAGFLTV